MKLTLAIVDSATEEEFPLGAQDFSTVPAVGDRVDIEYQDGHWRSFIVEGRQINLSHPERASAGEMSVILTASESAV